MAFNAWLTSDGLIAAVQRKISMPLAQGLMSAQDILDFATEELLISQVPSVLQYHEEYFVWQQELVLVPNKTKYAIPERAIAMKLRDVWYKDTGGSLYKMNRISPEDKGSYQRDNAGANVLQKYYFQGNNIVLTDYNGSESNVTLQLEYFLRPNRLVPDSRAAYIQSFLKSVTISNSSLLSGDTISINGATFIAGTDFAIGATSALTAANLSTAVGNSNVIVGATSSGAIVMLEFETRDTVFTTSNSAAFAISAQFGTKFTSDTPAHIVDGETIDFLQTRPGHSMRAMDIQIPTGGVSGSSIFFMDADVPSDLETGDYVALAGEAIIPMIPTDLHTALADRTCARILAAIGDQAGVDSINQKLTETELRQGTLLNNRVEGSLPKVVARNSLLRIGKFGARRGF